jgi:NADPH:quinone reductase
MSEAGSETMRAARVHAWGESPVIDHMPRPVPRAGESLVKVEAAAVAHLDLTVAGGEFGIKPDLPYIGGVEGSGIVVESREVEPGTRVVLRGGGLGLVRSGTWAEYVTVKSKALTLVAEGLSPDLAAVYWVPTTTAHTALHVVGRLGSWLDGVAAEDEVVVVSGAAGAVGSMAVQLARRAGAQVIALVASPGQVAAIPDGVQAVGPDDVELLGALTANRPATLLVDTVGGPGLIGRARWVRPGGRAVCIGYVAGTHVEIELSNWLLDDVALLPVNMIRREQEARAVAPEMSRLLVEGAIHLNVERYPLEETGRVIGLLKAGQVRGRAVVVPGTACGES